MIVTAQYTFASFLATETLTAFDQALDSESLTSLHF